MVFGLQPECFKCKKTESPIWKKEENVIFCLECYNLKFPNQSEVVPEKTIERESLSEVENTDKNDQDEPLTKVLKEEDNDNDKEKETKSSDKKESKKKSRKGKQGGKGNIPKGKGRRCIFKKSATKAPVAVSTPVTSEYLFYEGTYYQVGDIVSVIDIEGGTYYAQIRGLLQDQYCEKSAVITWLLPTKKSPPPMEGFDPASYIVGPEEDVPRKLEYLSFVCHAPSDYFKDRSSPYVTISSKPQSCFIWSKMGPVIKPI